MLMVSYNHYNTAYNRTRIFKKWSKDKQRSSKQAREWEGMHYQFLVVNSRGEYDLEEVGGSPSAHTTWRPVLKAPVGHHFSPAGPWFIRCHIVTKTLITMVDWSHCGNASKRLICSDLLCNTAFTSGHVNSKNFFHA